MSDRVPSEHSWPAWKLALAIGIPVAVAGVGVYYYTSRKNRTKDKSSAKAISRSEPEGSSSSPKKQQHVKEEPKESVPEPPKKSKLQEAQDLKTEGNRFFKQGQYEEAVKKYSSAIELCPAKNKSEKSTYHQNMAAAMEKMENWEGVVRECSAAIDLNQRYVKALYRRSKAYEKLGQKENSLEDITTVCILEGFQNQTSMMYADEMLKTVGKEKAAERFKKRATLLPSKLYVKQYFSSFMEDVILSPLTEEQKEQSPASAFIRAKTAFLDGNYDDIIQECTNEILSATDDDEAESKADQLVKYKWEAHLLRGTFYLLSGNSEAAKDDLDKVINAKEAHIKVKANALIKRGSMYMQQQHTDKAKTDFKTAIEIDPNNCDVYHHRGQLNILLDKVDEALEDFDMCVRLKPDFAIALAQKCYTVYRQGITKKDMLSAEKAKREFQEIIDKYPNCAETYGLFAQAQTDDGNYEKADELFQKAIEIEPDNATLYVHRGLLVLQWKQDVDQAVRFISKAIEVDHKCDFAHETMGTIEVQRGNLAKASKHFEVSIDYAKTETEMAHLIALQAAATTQANIAAKYGLRPPMPGELM